MPSPTDPEKNRFTARALLAPFGLDARDPKFWDGGLSVIANLIAELEALDAAK